MEHVTAISTVILAVVAVLAIYRDFIVGLFCHPDLKFGDTFFHRVQLRTFHEVSRVIIDEAETHYFRLKIFNDGKIPARDVEILVTEVRRKHADDKYKPMPIATPYNLHWTHRLEPSLPIIHPKSERHITLGYVVDPNKHSLLGFDYPTPLVKKGETLFTLEFTVKSTNREYLLKRGEYEIDLQIVSSNLQEPKKAMVRLNHVGEWFESESEMYSKGIGVTVHKS